MTYDEKKSLYESIMLEIARKLKKSINEAFKSSVMNDFIKYCCKYAKENSTSITLKYLFFDSQIEMLSINKEGEYRNGLNNFNISDLTDDNLYKEKFFDKEGIKKVIKKDSDKIHTRDIVDFIYSRDLFMKGLSCVVAEAYPKHIVIGALFIKKDGTLQIKKMLYKHNRRQQEKNTNPKLTDSQSKIDYQRQMFQIIKKDYNDFKKRYGDKAAIELGKTVNSMLKDDRVKSVLRQQLQDETDMKKYLYGFMMKINDPFKFMDFMERSKGLCNIRDEFYKKIEKK